MILVIFMFGFSILKNDAYVLLQVKKQDANHSNVDALIHRVVPSNKFDKFAKRIARNRVKNPGSEEIAQNAAMESRSEEGLALETNRDGHRFNINSNKPKFEHDPSPNAKDSDSEPNISDLLEGALKKVSRSWSGPVYRAKNKDVLLRPETVHLRSGKSSLYTLSPDTIEVAMKDILSSTTFQKYIDKLTRKAAAMYQSVQKEFFNRDGGHIMFFKD